MESTRDGEPRDARVGKSISTRVGIAAFRYPVRKNEGEILPPRDMVRKGSGVRVAKS